MNTLDLDLSQDFYEGDSAIECVWNTRACMDAARNYNTGIDVHAGGIYSALFKKKKKKNQDT